MEKMGKVFSAGIPPKRVQIWKYLARINFKAFTTIKKTWGANTSSLFQQQRGGWCIHRMGVDGGIGKMGKLFWLPFPQNLTKSGNIRPGLTSRHSLQEKKTQMSYTHPLLQHQSGDWWMAVIYSHFLKVKNTHFGGRISDKRVSTPRTILWTQLPGTL